ncbi:hypothetical protein J6590_068109 [Homalodisca vitripennis]|nr:hypothetical protein J6590_068109 [Homalodisca vitripennis]
MFQTELSINTSHTINIPTGELTPFLCSSDGTVPTLPGWYRSYVPQIVPFSELETPFVETIGICEPISDTNIYVSNLDLFPTWITNVTHN